MMFSRNFPSIGYLAIAIAAFFWAVAAIVASTLFEVGIEPAQLAMMRALIAALGLGLIEVYHGNPYKGWNNKRILALGLSLALVTVTYYLAIDRLAVAVAVVVQYSAPLLVVFFKAFQARVWPQLSTLWGAIVALLGVILVSGLGNQELSLDSWGLIAAGLSAVFFASYSLLSESLVNQYGAFGVMFRGFTFSGLFWLAIELPQGLPLSLLSLKTLPALLFVGIGGTLIPFGLMCWGIQRVQADKATIAATLEPVFAAILAWFLLNQSLTGLQVLGGILVLGSVTMLQLYNRLS